VSRQRWPAWSALVLAAWALVPAAVTAQAPQAVAAAYTLGVGDVVSVTVFEQAELSGKYTVGPDGGFEFPLIGRVTAAGKTARGLEADLRARLADGFLRNPQVSVEIAEFNSQRVFVMGAVQRPGPVPLTGALTLLEALTAAGGATEGAGTEMVLVRARPGERVAGPILPGTAAATDITRLMLRDVENGTLRENVSLRDGDTIFVARGESIFVLGEVRTPGQVPFQRDMTVLRAISLAGGATATGATGRVKVIRIVDGKQTEIKVKLTDTLLPGDTVTVPTRFF
jgi:polysaccharide export outer membrane protein